MSAPTELGRERTLVAFPAKARLTAFLAENGMVVGLVGLFVVFWSLSAPDWLAADSWLTFLGGREITAHGIPRNDALTVLTSGHPWVDQQWLAQLALWQLVRIGGIRLGLMATIVLMAVPLVLAIVLARRRGAAPLAIVPFAALSGLAFSSFLRAQLFSQLLFVPLLALLSAESRRSSRRVFVVFPLLALWANLHGAVLEAAALVALLGACEAVERRRLTLRAGVLLLGPWLCVLATPYGFETADYYRRTLGNPTLRHTLTEWAAPTFPSVFGVTLFVLAGAALATVARRARLLTTFEIGALALTLLGALLAVRSIVWFGYTALVFVPPLIVLRQRPAPGQARVRIAFAAGAAVAALVTFLSAAASPGTHLRRYWPDGAIAAVRNVTAPDPQARVLASYQFGDWLLYELPALRGRVAFDGRWETLTHAQTVRIFAYLFEAGSDWEQLSRGYRLLVLSPSGEKSLVRTYRRRGLRVLFESKWVIVFDRGGGR